MAYQKYMPKECNFSTELVKIVEAYRHAANHVVIFLNRANRTSSIDSQLEEVSKNYFFGSLDLNAAIRKIAITKRLSNTCYNSIMLMQRAIYTTGEGLVAATLITYNGKCPSNRRILLKFSSTVPATTIPDPD